MNLEGYVACICEGSAEQAVMEILIEEGKLIFSEDKLLGGEIIRKNLLKKRIQRKNICIENTGFKKRTV